jgi:hypothetical protein
MTDDELNNSFNDELNDGRVTFYYSREERLKKAPQSVRDLHKEQVYRKPNLFRTLTATKSLTFLFISIITLCAALVLVSRFVIVEGERTLGNNTVVVSAITSGDNSYISVTKTIPDTAAIGSVYSGAVDIAVSVPGAGNPIHTERVYFGPEPEEVFRFVAPFTGKKLLVLMEAGAERVHLTITPE